MILTLARLPNKQIYSTNASRMNINTYSTGMSGSNNSYRLCYEHPEGSRGHISHLTFSLPQGFTTIKHKSNRQDICSRDDLLTEVLRITREAEGPEREYGGERDKLP